MDADDLPEVEDLEVAALAATALPTSEPDSESEETSSDEDSSEVRFGCVRLLLWSYLSYAGDWTR